MRREAVHRNGVEQAGEPRPNEGAKRNLAAFAGLRWAARSVVHEAAKRKLAERLN